MSVLKISCFLGSSALLCILFRFPSPQSLNLKIADFGIMEMLASKWSGLLFLLVHGHLLFQKTVAFVSRQFLNKPGLPWKRNFLP